MKGVSIETPSFLQAIFSTSCQKPSPHEIGSRIGLKDACVKLGSRLAVGFLRYARV